MVTSSYWSLLLYTLLTPFTLGYIREIAENKFRQIQLQESATVSGVSKAGKLLNICGNEYIMRYIIIRSSTKVVHEFSQYIYRI